MPSPAERVGQRVSLGLYIGLVTAFTLICSLQVILQAWATPAIGLPVNCPQKAESLLQGLRRAREAARKGDSEQHSLELFRTALGPDWDAKNSIANACANNAPSSRLIREIDQLRYAEEHAVRYEARELTQRRQRVSTLERELGLDPAPH